ncbi:sensor histidine kinase [Actinoallomurus rhizosphaericola]|uniref:sensor histidine kinase n=1 Tax=Actinoallomurus rhizosphaericola TaxID=2952536 RepID=UPI002090D190|nr:histidine kinase [Actinoallomurus rhizosphaericola]MCO5992008.1 histidine kinase [Actinoallomurus rhizosphaericola]
MSAGDVTPRQGSGWKGPAVPRGVLTPRRVDAAVAAGLFAWGAPDVPWWWKPASHVPATPVVLGYLGLELAASVPFLWRRRAPVPVLLATSGVLAVRTALHQHAIAVFAAVLVAAYGVGAYGGQTRRHARWLGWLGLITGAVVGVAVNLHRVAGVPFALLGAAFLVGDAATARRAEAALAVEAAHLTERTRIARELHDVLVHQLSAITVQAGAARLTGSAPAEALGTVERLAREALNELNHLLGTLRRDDEKGGPRRPVPSLAEIDALIAMARDAGVPADLEVTGRARELSPGLQLSAYRIVQESLTNVARHAPGAATRVALRYLDDHLAVEITNGPPGRGRRGGRSASGGRGLLGMRERAESLGGDLRASATDGGFRVTAALPYGAWKGGS